MRPDEQSDMAAVIVDATFRSRVHAVAERFDGVRVVASSSWMPFVDRLQLGERLVDDAAAPALVVGPPAVVLRHASQETGNFAFVMPVAQLAKPWQRIPSWRDNATLDLWHAGWSPVAIDRLLVAGDVATVEFVIGNARQTPTVAQY